MGPLRTSDETRLVPAAGSTWAGHFMPTKQGTVQPAADLVRGLSKRAKHEAGTLKHMENDRHVTKEPVDQVFLRQNAGNYRVDLGREYRKHDHLPISNRLYSVD